MSLLQQQTGALVNGLVVIIVSCHFPKHKYIGIEVRVPNESTQSNMFQIPQSLLRCAGTSLCLSVIFFFQKRAFSRLLPWRT